MAAAYDVLQLQTQALHEVLEEDTMWAGFLFNIRCDNATK